MSTTAPTIHRNVIILQEIYADLTRLEDHASDDIVLHEAEREQDASGYVGKPAAVQKERELIGESGGTLVMDVHQIMANDHYGAALGVLRAHHGDDTLAVPFCGLWRFEDGLIVEHWENAYDVPALRRFLTS
jgi:SnoaL-like domain